MPLPLLGALAGMAGRIGLGGAARAAGTGAKGMVGKGGGMLEKLKGLVGGDGKPGLAEAARKALGDKKTSSSETISQTPGLFGKMLGSSKEDREEPRRQLAEQQMQDNQEDLAAGMEHEREVRSQATKELISETLKAGTSLTGLAVAAISMPFILKKLSGALVESQRRLAEFNGGIAGAFATLDAHRYAREAKRAAGTEQSTKVLIESQNRLENATLPLEQAWSNVSNQVFARLDRAAAAMVEMLMDTPLVGDLIKWLAKDEHRGDAQAWVKFLDDIGDGKWQDPGIDRRAERNARQEKKDRKWRNLKNAMGLPMGILPQ